MPDVLVNGVKYKLGYRFGRRPVEKTIAFIASAVIYFGCAILAAAHLSGSMLVAGFFGMFAGYLLGILEVSAMTEGWLIPVALILIGLKYGFSGLGMAFVGWLLFACLTLVVLALANTILYRSTGDGSH
jgi:hypothetical protein